jgi:predicted permease
LKPGLSLAQAQANLLAVAESMVRDLPKSYDERSRSAFQTAAAEDTVYLEPLDEFVVGQTRATLVLLAVTAAFLLVVACANVAMLLLARAVQRARELSLRLALGASPRRLGGQLLIEAVVLTVAGGAAAVVTITLLQPWLRRALPTVYPRVDEIAVDSAAMGWVAGLSLVTAVVIGLAPGWLLSHANPGETLKRGGLTTTGAQPATWRRVLVAVQVALVVLLMLGGGLLVRSLWKLRQVDLGFDGSGVITMELRMLDPKYRNPQALRFFEEQLLASVRAIPGVERASMSSAIPMRGNDTLMAVTTASGRHRVNRRVVDRDFFEVLRIPIRAGRVFETVEDGDVAVVSESAARLLFPSRNPIGEILDVTLLTTSRARIVGVVGDVRYQRVEAPALPALYLPLGQSPAQTIRLLVRGPVTLADTVRKSVAAIDPRQPIEDVTTLDDVVTASIQERRFYAVAAMAFSLTGLILAVTGLYGVISRGVAERFRELGIRIALGATRRDITSLVFLGGLQPIAAGLAGGVIAAFWATRLLQRFLFEIGPLDPMTYFVAPAAVLAITGIACWMPARRAARTNPVDALRLE